MKVFLTFAALLVLSISAYSQTNSDDCAAWEIPGASKVANGWERHFVGRLSVCLPIELRPVKLECFEGGCGLFESQRFSFSIDFNLAAWRPTSEKYLPTYKEEVTTLDGKQAWIWYFEQDGKFKGTSGIKLKVKGKDEYDLGLYFSSAQPGYHDLAKKIFNSIKLFPVDYKKSYPTY